MKTRLLFGLFIAVFGLGSTVAAQEIDQMESALKQAQEENKGVALYVYSDSLNTPSSLSDVFGGEDDWVVQAYLEKHFVPIYINADSAEGQELDQQYNAIGWYPTLFILDQEGDRKAFMMIDGKETEPGDFAHFFLMNEIGPGWTASDK
ncbi:MAG: hypothetical protein KTR29_23590 [Rhodothermaceae bacterium]|nr:hypothetical protein [Rhodothermaceae bacterium]